MPSDPGSTHQYANPILDLDVPDPDVIALSTGGYALVASSFDRSPGLPLWRSDDLLEWTPIGHAGGYRDDAPHDGGVWAPSLREHDGRLHVVCGDPDRGVLVVDAPGLEGPWSEPRLILAGSGIIDPCPLWDDDGRTYLVHGWARSRAGFANRLDVVEVDAGLTRALGGGRVVIDGDSLDGCSTLEGPKVYRRDGELWILAPAGGVSTGWQYAFRAPGWDGPWQHRIVLAQHGTAVNGPHQGAWVVGDGGEEWFLHFQAKGALGRVLHLQPAVRDADGWPVIGSAGAPVAEARTPRVGTVPPPEPRGSDTFETGALSAAWHARGVVPADLVSSIGDGRLTLTGHPRAALLRPLDGAHRAVQVAVVALEGASAALVIEDAVARELQVRSGGTGVEIIERDSGRPAESVPGIGGTIGFSVENGVARFLVDGDPVGAPFTLQGRRWTGAEWGLAARGPGTVVFGVVEVSS